MVNYTYLFNLLSVYSSDTSFPPGTIPKISKWKDLVYSREIFLKADITLLLQSLKISGNHYIFKWIYPHITVKGL